MRKAVTVSLPEDIYREAGAFCKSSGAKISEIVRDAVRDFLFKRRMEDSRRKFTAYVRRKGIYTEEDLLKRLG